MIGTPPLGAGKLAFFATPEHDCSYLPGRRATTVFADPNHPKSRELYTRLCSAGFRRSGEHVYIPACEHCSACVAVRVDVNEFSPRRIQRRIAAKNAHLRVVERTASYDEAHYELYKRYAFARHRGEGMDGMNRDEYREFLSSAWAQTMFVEFHEGDELVAVAVTDRLDDGLSAVYTFFDPTRDRLSLGVYAILWQIARAKAMGLRFHYLGYWIADSQKMRYKVEYLPQQHFVNGRWRLIHDLTGAISPNGNEVGGQFGQGSAK
jgi:arginyl-tRNA--protein-N-Asp/Glu arginylyltransferase